MQDYPYRTIFIKKTNLKVIEYMFNNKYPLNFQQTGEGYLKLNLRNYVCLDDLINQNHIFHISAEGVIFIFVQLYYIIKELNEKRLQYFKIEKQHIWININDNWIDGIILTHPQRQFESNFENNKFKKQIFLDIYSILEQYHSSSNSKQLLEYCLKFDMHNAANIEPQIDKSHIRFSKVIINSLENSLSQFMEQLKQIDCNIKEFRYILQNISYYFYKAILQERSLVQLNEQLINNLIELKTTCHSYDPSYQELSQFIFQEHIIDKLNSQQYFLDGSFNQDYQKFIFISQILREIKQIINIDEQQIFELVHDFNDIFTCTQEQKQKILQNIQKNIFDQVRIQLQQLS